MTTTYPVVKTNSGPVKGISRKTETGKLFYSFQHIPYVQQPKGELRFRDPKPVEPWEATLDCTKEGSTCYIFDTLKTGTPVFSGSDDCLGVNIFIPNLKPWRPLPVCVWIHGGGFVTGSSTISFYGPDLIVEKDVIMVSFNYRLGVFGFLSLKDPKLGVPGNAGLKDQSMALKWIKENIKFFGGDSNNITLFGESAGAGSVHYQLISPMSKGLFKKAISLSGVALNPWATAPKVYPDCLKRLAVALGLTEDADESELLKAMSECEPMQLLILDATLMKPEEKLGGAIVMSSFLPQVEPYTSEMCFLPAPPLELGRDAWSKDIDVIFGGCANEGCLFYAFCPDENGFAQINKQAKYLLPRDLQDQISNQEGNTKGLILKQLYFGNKDISKENIETYLSYLDEHQFWHGIHRAVLQRQTSNGSGKTYLYRLNTGHSKTSSDYYDFLRKAINAPDISGTWHSEDLPLLFKMDFLRRVNENDDIYVGQQIFFNSFIEFIKRGNPSCQVGGKIMWEPLPKERSDNVPSMEIRADSGVVQQLSNYDKIKVWNDLYDNKQSLF